MGLLSILRWPCRKFDVLRNGVARGFLPTIPLSTHHAVCPDCQQESTPRCGHNCDQPTANLPSCLLRSTPWRWHAHEKVQGLVGGLHLWVCPAPKSKTTEHCLHCLLSIKSTIPGSLPSFRGSHNKRATQCAYVGDDAIGVHGQCHNQYQAQLQYFACCTACTNGATVPIAVTD